MRIIFLSCFTLAASVAPVTGQSAAFIDQAPRGLPTISSGHTLPSGAFVQQMPPESRVKSSVQATARPVFVEKVYFVSAPNSAKNPDLVLYGDVGLVLYGEAKRPALPTLSSVPTVVVNSPGQRRNLPDVGAGAVRL